MSLTGLDGSAPAKINWGDIQESTPLTAILNADNQSIPLTASTAAATSTSTSPAPAAATQQTLPASTPTAATTTPATAIATTPPVSTPAASTPAASTPAAAAAPSSSSSSSSSSSTGDASTSALATQLESAAVIAPPADSKEEEEAQINAFTGLHPNDSTAQVSVSSTIYNSVSSFEQLGLSKELLSGVYEMKFNAPSKIQAQALPIILSQAHPNLIGQAHHGSGKCWGLGTLMLLFDGRVKRVEHVAAGDKLMGDDNTHRTVQNKSCIVGTGEMYQVTSTDDGKDVWTCNGDHILVLKLHVAPRVEQHGRVFTATFWNTSTQHKAPQLVVKQGFNKQSDAQQAIPAHAYQPIIFEVTVDEYLNDAIVSSALRANCQMFQPSSVQFESPKLSLSSRLSTLGVDTAVVCVDDVAWLLGVWLADGVCGTAVVQQALDHTQSRRAMENKIQTIAQLIDQQTHAVRATTLSANGSMLYELELGSTIEQLLTHYGMLNNKHIPLDLLRESESVRCALFAGLVDGFGSVCDNGSYELFCCSSLVADIQQLCRSIGLRTGRVQQQQVQHEETGKSISAHVFKVNARNMHNKIRTVLAYKQCEQSIDAGDESSAHFTIKSIGVDNYYGFTVDGNGRFLLGDFTVTHNTAAFSLGLLSRINLTNPSPQALVLTPTRELAVQVASVISSLSKYTGIKVYTAIPQKDASGKSIFEKVDGQVIVGTPGTIDSRISKRDFDIKSIIMFVCDEADQMIQQDGLRDTTVLIKKKLPRNTQILLFSATFDEQIKKFAKVVAPNAVEIMVKTEELSLDGIKQYYMECSNELDKYKALTEIFSLLEIGQSIIFVHTVATAKALANKMRADGYTVSLLHGKDMEPQERDRVMADFRSGKTTVLITTNVLARGIDVLAVTLVINFDIPLTRNNAFDPDTYIHRIGRSGRFGRKGVAINFIHNEFSKRQLAGIAAYFKHNIVQLPRNELEKVTEIVQKDLK